MKNLLLTFGAVAVLAVVGTMVFMGSAEKSVMLEYMSTNEVPTEVYDAFNKWVGDNNKVYASPQEKMMRFNNFYETYKRVQAVNEQELSYKFALNKFSDMSIEQFRGQYLGVKQGPRTCGSIFKSATPAAEQDWTKKGAVTPIKNQGNCGSCWAFSTTGGLEGLYQIKTGKLQSFSEQQLVDCANSVGCQGCNGCWMDWAYKYVSEKGIELESVYPYTAQTQRCKYNASSVIFKIASCTDVEQYDSVSLAASVTHQPTSIAIDAVPIMNYQSGIFTGHCGEQLDHGVLAVGFGEQGKQMFWKVKNSWGADWGMQGYFMLARTTSTNSPGKCGLCMAASFPNWEQ